MEAHLDCAMTGVERILACLEGGAGALLPPGTPSSVRSGGCSRCRDHGPPRGPPPLLLVVLGAACGPLRA
eukprot:7828855-Pyramimonas_sp.AAC.1